MNRWTELLSREDIEAQRKLTASLDPVFAKRDAEFWDSRTASQLHVLRHQAWLLADSEQWQLAGSLLALMGEKVES